MEVLTRQDWRSYQVWFAGLGGTGVGERVKIASCRPESAALVLVAFCSQLVFPGLWLKPSGFEGCFQPASFVQMRLCLILPRV